MVSGPPGIGKSSMIRLVAQALDYDVVENNASDLRNKLNINNQISDLTDNELINSKNKKFIILMDEVDGMTGSDRGGLQALTQIIKNTKTPIVCVCNDNESQKLRTLITYCNPIKFQKPTFELIAKR